MDCSISAFFSIFSKKDEHSFRQPSGWLFFMPACRNEVARSIAGRFDAGHQ
jgi:hypothetical protein